MGAEPNRMKKKQPERKPQAFDIVVVSWEDATASGSQQHESPAATLASYTPCIRRTTGYWAGRTKDVVCVCTDDDRTASSPLAIAGPMWIPASLVRGITVVSSTQIVLK